MASITAPETGHFHQDHQTLSGTKHDVRSQKCQQQQQKRTGYQKYKTTNKINMYMHYFSQLNEYNWDLTKQHGSHSSP